jgi:hypothetical protein
MYVCSLSSDSLNMKRLLILALCLPAFDAVSQSFNTDSLFKHMSMDYDFTNKYDVKIDLDTAVFKVFPFPYYIAPGILLRVYFHRDAFEASRKTIVHKWDKDLIIDTTGQFQENEKVVFFCLSHKDSLHSSQYIVQGINNSTSHISAMTTEESKEKYHELLISAMLSANKLVEKKK